MGKTSANAVAPTMAYYLDLGIACRMYKSMTAEDFLFCCVGLGASTKVVTLNANLIEISIKQNFSIDLDEKVK